MRGHLQCRDTLAGNEGCPLKTGTTVLHRNILPHHMEKVSSTVLVGVQSQLSDGRLFEKTMM